MGHIVGADFEAFLAWSPAPFKKGCGGKKVKTSEASLEADNECTGLCRCGVCFTVFPCERPVYTER